MSQLQFRSDDSPSKWKYGFGNGSTGSTYAVPSNEGCSSTLASKTLTLASAGSFSDGDLILIHQTRGTNAGHWQLNKILSGAGTTTLTLESDTTLAYADSGANQAQVIEINQYEDLTVGALTVPDWDGSKGGIVAILDKGTCTVDSTINGTGKGHLLGVQDGSSAPGQQGEGTGGAGANLNAANGNGGGGGNYSSGTWGGGGGGGNGAAGTTGQTNTHIGSAAGGVGGSAVGSASLVTMNLGGGGGASKDRSGGDGGGMAFIFANNIVITGAITMGAVVGATRASGDLEGAGGGGAGGSVLLKAVTATLGSGLITCPGAAGGTAPKANGGAGAVGRIHLDYSDSFTGTTSPSIDATEDTTIVATSNTGNMFMLF